MYRDLACGVRFTLVIMLLCGGAYPLLVWSLGRLAFPSEASGSLIVAADGHVLGSRLIAQPFTRTEYFHPRPSAVDYNGAAAGGSNLGPSNPEHVAAVRRRMEEVMRREGIAARRVPSELITTSGSGLDPDLSPHAAQLQAARVAAARHMDVDRLQALIREHTVASTLGFLGGARVNVLELNLALDAMSHGGQ
jgi:potassium-transporting ATPase KdpC subunit